MSNGPVTSRSAAAASETAKPRIKVVPPSFIDAHLAPNKSRTHWILYCPFCPDHGKSPDTEGKLYVSKAKEVGHCFRCHTKLLVSHDGLDGSTASSEMMRLTDSILSGFEGAAAFPPIPYFDRLFPNDAERLGKLAKLVCWRSPKYLDLIERGDLRYYEVVGKFDQRVYPALVLPFRHDGQVLYYQLRWQVIPPWLPQKMKYWMPPGKKPLYALDGDPFAPVEELTLVEGVIDNWGAVKMGLPHVRSVLGSSIPDHHAAVLRANLNLKRINIFLDSTQLSLQLAHSLRDAGVTLPQIRIIESDGADPDERYLAGQTAKDLVFGRYRYLPPEKR